MGTGSEAEKHRGLVTAYATDNMLGDVGDAMNVCSPYVWIMHRELTLMQTYLDISHEATSISTSACVLNSEIDTIAAVLGGE
jgi:hypothetical protein